MKGETLKQFSLKMLRCEARVSCLYGIRLHDESAILFTPRKTRMHINLDHVTSGGETFIASSIGHWQ